MNKAKIIKIDSLEKYIAQIKKVESIHYFRGENRIYPSRVANAFRDYGDNRWNSKHPFPFVEMIDEFYKEIAYKLSEERADFIAFAQHHGIPTNLIDITTSPLVALYFAVESEMDKTGVVYVMDDCYVDLTGVIHAYPNKNIIEEVFSNTPQELNVLAPLFERFKEDFPDRFNSLLRILIAEYLEAFDFPFSKEEKDFQKELRKKNFDPFMCIMLLGNIVEGLEEFDLQSCDADVYLYLALQYHYFKETRTVQEPIFFIHFLPNLIYRPIINFERGRNQQGLFLSQMYMTYIEPMYEFRVLVKQEVEFANVELHISNKREILKDLDRIGINRKTIFCDYDSIAKYIKEKYSVPQEKDLLNSVKKRGCNTEDGQ